MIVSSEQSVGWPLTACQESLVVTDFGATSDALVLQMLGFGTKCLLTCGADSMVLALPDDLPFLVHLVK